MADKTSTIKTIFALDGETTYRNAIKGINQEQKLLRSELSLATQKLLDQGDKAGAARASIESLNKQIELQKRRVEEAKNAVEQANQKWGEASEESKRYRTDLNYAEAALYRLEGALKTSTEELARQESKLIQVGDALESAGSKMQGVGDKLGKAGNQLSTKVTAPLMLGAGYATKAFMDFETGVTGVAKTVDMTAEEFDAMKQSIREMAIELPGTTEDIAGLAEIAGQLGIKKENILDFVEVMTRLGVSSNLAGEEGASMLAKYANITGMDQSEFENLASTIVGLGNKTATTEKDIMEMSMRLGAAGRQAGMTDPEILAMAASLSSVGLEAQAGGSAMSKAISRIQLEVETGGDALADFAAVAGMSVEDFSKAFEEDALGAVMAFVSGLSDVERNGASAIQLIDELGLSDIRLKDSLLRLTGAQDMVNESIQIANEAWAENTSLRKESDMFMNTSAQNLEKERDRLKDVAITLGEQLIPHLADFTAFLAKSAQAFNSLDTEQQKTIITMLGIAAAAGPVLKVTGSVTKGVGLMTEGLGHFIKKSGEKKAIEGVTAALGAGPGGMAASMATLGPLIGIAAGALALFAAQALEGPTKFEQLQKVLEGFGDGVVDYMDKLANAGSAFDGFAGGVSFSSEKMGELDRQIRDTHTNIIEIARTAAEENRALTEEERLALEELTGLLTKYTEEKLNAFIQQQSAYRTFAENEKIETDAQAAALINGARDAADETISVARNMYQEQLRLADELHGERGSKDKRAHAEAVAQAQQRYENEVALAEKTRLQTVQSVVDKWNEVNVSGEEFKEKYTELTTALSILDDEREQKLSESTETERSIFGEKEKINAQYVREKAQLTDQLISLFGDEADESLKSWVAMVMYAQTHGASLSAENKKVMDNIIGLMQELPSESKENFKQMMLSAIDGMVSQNPALASEAEKMKKTITDALDGGYWPAYESGASIGQGIQDGIWSKFADVTTAAGAMATGVKNSYKQHLAIQSPSRVMFEQGQQTAEGVILGLKNRLPDIRKQSELMAEAIRSPINLNDINIGVPTIPAGARSEGSDEMVTLLREIRDKDSSIIMDERVVGKIMSKQLNTRLGRDLARR